MPISSGSPKHAQGVRFPTQAHRLFRLQGASGLQPFSALRGVRYCIGRGSIVFSAATAALGAILANVASRAGGCRIGRGPNESAASAVQGGTRNFFAESDWWPQRLRGSLLSKSALQQSDTCQLITRGALQQSDTCQLVIRGIGRTGGIGRTRKSRNPWESEALARCLCDPQMTKLSG